MKSSAVALQDLDLGPIIVPYQIGSTRLVLVGEAPGAEEVKQGRPFCGRSGQLLDKTLAAVGIDRASLTVANVFRRQPPKNQLKHFFLSRKAATEQGAAVVEAWGKYSGAFPRADYACDIDYLASSLAQWGPKIIVALGRTPMWALTGLEKMGDARGALQTCRMKGVTAPVLPTYHPSFILRGNWGLIPEWEKDFIKAKELAG